MSISARVTTNPNISTKITPQDRVLVTNYRLNKIGITVSDDINDIDMTTATQGSVLVYQETSGIWLATKTLDEQLINGGNF